MKTEFRIMKKFACGNDVFISMSMPTTVEDTSQGRTITGNTLHLLTFDECADHLREEVCSVLGADTTYLASIEE